MFKDLFVLEKERTWKEAFGFYLAYLFIGFVSVLLIVLLLPPYYGSVEEGYKIGQKYNEILNPTFSLVLSFVILFKKKKIKSFKLLLIALLSAPITSIFGLLLGLVPTAYLSTIENNA